jgi:hypothetical protein
LPTVTINALGEILAGCRTRHSAIREDALEKEVEEAKRNRIWERLGYQSIDDVLEKEVGADKESIAVKVKIARDTKDKRKRGPIVSPNVVETGSTNSNANVLRRIARDMPELLDAIESRELSVNAASIKAGIRKKPTAKA